MTQSVSVPSAPLSFHSTQFDIVERSDQPWLRLPQVGAALGFKNPYHAQKVYDRNAAEFTDSMTAVVKLPTAGGVQDVRIFSLRGAHLLGMFARTPIAAEFRRWVLDILDRASAQKPALRAPRALTINGTVEAAGYRLHVQTGNVVLPVTVPPHQLPFKRGDAITLHYAPGARPLAEPPARITLRSSS